MQNPSTSAPTEPAWTDPLLANPHAVSDKAARVNKMFSAITAPMSGKVRFMLVANTDKAGVDIDLVYDRFTVSPGMLFGAPKPGNLP